MKNRKLKFRLEGAAFAAMVIAAVILLNLVAGVLGDKYDLKADLTGGGVFTLSNETKASWGCFPVWEINSRVRKSMKSL